jgi:hypothetical protein
MCFTAPRSILSDGGGHWVYVLSEDGYRASKRELRTGFRNIREVEVLEGLYEGERVITSSYKAFRDKEIIRIKGAGDHTVHKIAFRHIGRREFSFAIPFWDCPSFCGSGHLYPTPCIIGLR